jgi:hypothetical protein
MFGEHRNPLTENSPKLVDFVHSRQFSMVLLTDYGFRVNRDVWETSGSAYGDLAKTRRFGPFWQFSIAVLTDFGSRVDLDVWVTPGFAHGDLAKTHRFGPFWPVFYCITN